MADWLFPLFHLLTLSLLLAFAFLSCTRAVVMSWSCLKGSFTTNTSLAAACLIHATFLTSLHRYYFNNMTWYSMAMANGSFVPEWERLVPVSNRHFSSALSTSPPLHLSTSPLGLIPQVRVKLSTTSSSIYEPQKREQPNHAS
ncbi:hypothetical protein BKA57DRAFT_451353 [Linnemannia elongata]|nr:hypothetical protein BKA57DRAFT_451353 [Linnemannia elongata]